jgi:hypothetical protein
MDDQLGFYNALPTFWYLCQIAYIHLINLCVTQCLGFLYLIDCPCTKGKRAHCSCSCSLDREIYIIAGKGKNLPLILQTWGIFQSKLFLWTRGSSFTSKSVLLFNYVFCNFSITNQSLHSFFSTQSELLVE